MESMLMVCEDVRVDCSAHFGRALISLARPLAPDIVGAIVGSIAFAKLDPVYGTAGGKRQATSLS